MLEITNARSGPYVCDGTVREFDFDFPVIDPSHVAVYMDGERLESSAYGLGTWPGGGRVTMNNTPANGSRVAIVRDVPMLQEVDLQNNTAFLPEVIESAMDRLTMICQQMQEILSRTLTAPPTEDLDQAQLFEQFMGIPYESAMASSAAAAAASSAAAAEEDKGAALAYKTEAFQYYQNCVAFYNLADAAALAAATAKTAAEQAKQIAQGASTNASQSAITAAQCESGALVSKDAAAISEQNAAQYESGALASKNAAAISEQNAAASAAAAANVSGIEDHNADVAAHPSLQRPLGLLGPEAIYPGKLTVPHYRDLSTSLSYVRAEVRLLCLTADRGYSPGDVITQAMTYREVLDPGPPAATRTVPVPIPVRLDLQNAIVELGKAVSDGVDTPSPIFAPDNTDPSVLAPLEPTSWMLYIHIWL